MINEGLNYATFVLFICDPLDSLRTPGNIDAIVERIRSSVVTLGYRAKCYGYLSGGSKPDIPRSGLLTDAKLLEWRSAIIRSNETKMCIVDSDTRKGVLPRLFASFGNFPMSISPGRYGAEYCITFAAEVGEPARVEDYVEKLLIEFTRDWDVINGNYERGVRWDRPSDMRSFREWMFDDRCSDIVGAFRGDYNMSDCLPRLFLGNVFTKKHLVCDTIEDIPSEYVARLVSFGDRYYCRFVIDPQDDPEFNAKVEPFFNVIPPEKRRPMRRDPK